MDMEAYRCAGVGVGYVGILRSEGGFDYLSNVCRIPKGFEPIVRGNIRAVETMYKRYYDTRSASVSRIEISGGRGVEFIRSREKMCHSCTVVCYDALNVYQFRSYASQNVHTWYQFANTVYGRGALKVSLSLITGCDKAYSWGVASFFDPADKRSFSLKFFVGGAAEGKHQTGIFVEEHVARAYPEDMRLPRSSLERSQENNGGGTNHSRNKGTFLREKRHTWDSTTLYVPVPRVPIAYMSQTKFLNPYAKIKGFIPETVRYYV
ncbi:hypothetical protein DFS33DRAFT_1401505 [Desarmillaria ectypa]|nr:hypothetical protein DFS33DRAFT_1401505 [Desarmillaria ectypa]